jgi:hypothetical protein
MDTSPSRRRAAVTRTSNGSGAFLGWIVAELAGYGLLVTSASDQQSITCTGLCFTERELLLYLGLVFGFWVVLAQTVLGLVITERFHRGGMSPSAAGSAAFFSTFAVVAAAVGLLIGAQR